jgi:hypothetical protein
MRRGIEIEYKEKDFESNTYNSRAKAGPRRAKNRWHNMWRDRLKI